MNRGGRTAFTGPPGPPPQGGSGDKGVPLVDYNGDIWTSPPRPAVYGAPTHEFGTPPAGAILQAQWGTGLLDLRPDLGNRTAYEAEAAPVSAGYQRGANDSLHMYLTNLGDVLSPLSVGFYRFFSVETAAAQDPTRAAFINRPEDVTLAVLQGNTASDSAMLRWTPPGPVRYWGVTLFVWTYDATAFEPFMVSGGMY